MEITLDTLDLIDLIEKVLDKMAYKLPYYNAELEDGRKVPQVARLVIAEEMFRKIFANLREEMKKMEEMKNVKN